MHKEENLIDILDIGSRGKIPDQWLWFLKNNFKLRINTFDIDTDADLKQKDNILYINHKVGLSSNNYQKEFYLCEERSQSSCFEPNKEIDIFEDQHHLKRLKYKKIISKNISTIDYLFKNQEKIDFIKCDTQGSEYDISLGSRKSLKNFCPIVALETWCEDVYSNMPLDFNIRSLYREMGYKLFATDVAAAWRYKTNKLFPLSRQRLIGENLLFVPSLKMFDKLDKSKIISKIPILCFFGFYDYAYTIINRKGMQYYLPNLKKLYKKFSNERKLHRKILNRISGKRDLFPRIT